MKILSMTWTGGCSTAAIMIDGEIIACVSEERFSRIKNDESYPKQSIEAVLDIGGVVAKELDFVACSGERFDPISILCHKLSRFSIQDRLKEQYQYWYPSLLEKKEVSYLDIFGDKLDTLQYPGEWDEVLVFLKKGNQENANAFFQDFRRKVVIDHLGIDPQKIIFPHHHRAHGYYAYYGSQMGKNKKTLIFTVDAWGDDMNASVSIAEGGNIKILGTSKDFIIGRLYRYITLLLGMKPDEHEFKVMGLAAYSKPKYYQEPLKVFQNTMYVDGMGFAYNEIPSDLYFYFKERLEGYRFDSIAGAIQKYTEDIMVEWVKNALKYTGARKVVLGGGVAMNIKAMMEIAKLQEIDDIFICPTPSDESSAMGAAYVAMHDICHSSNLEPDSYLKHFKNAYLGPQASSVEVKEVADNAYLKGYIVHEKPKMYMLANLLADGKIIGRCVGRSEFGARAFGNRSILADPSDLSVVNIINEKIKSRDFWMPFAPSILDEMAENYLVNPKKINASFMSIAFETTPLARQHLKAAIHQCDFTVRPQIVTKKENSEYYELLLEFYKLTGVGGILNTSFNVHGEPIVQTPKDAFDVFERTDLDALILDGYAILKNKQFLK